MYRSHPKVVLSISFRWLLSCTNIGPTCLDMPLFQNKQDILKYPRFKQWQLIPFIFKHCIGKYSEDQAKHNCRWWNIVYFSPLEAQTSSFSCLFILSVFQDQVQELPSLWSSSSVSPDNMNFTPLCAHYTLTWLLSHHPCIIFLPISIPY